MEKEIAQKLLEMQVNLNAPKDLRNNFGGFNYRSAESILKALKPLEKKFECVVTIDDDIVLIGNYTYIKATATLTDCKTGFSHSATAFAREGYDKKGMDPSQMTGATSSYARKYALNALFGIDDNKDPDTEEFHYQTEAEKVASKKAYDDLVKKAIAAVKAAKTAADVKNVYNSYDQSVQKAIYDIVVETGKKLSAKAKEDK